MSSNVESTGMHCGLDWECAATTSGYRCGYVRVPTGHPLHGLGYGDAAPGVEWESVKGRPLGKRSVLTMFCVDPAKPATLDVVFDVHGSLTFAGPRGDDCGSWWLGFDCAHRGDKRDPELMSSECAKWSSHDNDGTVRTRKFVEEECRSLAAQIADLYPIAAETMP